MGFPWTADIREEMKTMWAEGKSGKEIALFLSEKYGAPLTRCAVLGQINRLGRVVRDSLRTPEMNRANRGWNRKPAVKVERRAAPKQQPAEEDHSWRGSTFRFGKGRDKAPEERPQLHIPSTDTEDLAPLIHSIMDLGERHCRWPYGESNFSYCGRHKTSGSSYGCEHLKLNFRQDTRHAKRKLGHQVPPPVQRNSIMVEGPIVEGRLGHRQRPQTNHKSRLQRVS